MKRHTQDTLLRQWHALLALPRQPSAAWQRARLHEELAERRAAATRISQLSETADVVFTISRARHDGHATRGLPHASAAVLLYMVAKFSMRWAFYHIVAFACGARGERLRRVRQVVNPAKMSKVEEVAGRHGLDREAFARWAARVKAVWPLLP
ncbi:hypothetical protein PspLS_11961 [Pyricularia sp. CBS 133598]|nr:hypothetical protein PspLS_11961 [Pyricularia sp. CBS 133598]